MARYACGALTAVLFLAVGLASADDKAKKPIGKWTRTVGDASVTFDITADKLVCTLKGGGGSLKAEATYEVDKDGLLKGKLTKVESEGIEGPQEGDKFSFKFKIADGTMTLSDLKDKDDNEAGGQAKDLIEGDYKKETKKEK
jgi:hypothetical protein